MKFQITFLGANSLFGRVATALLSKTPYVRTLKLYDEVENPQLGSASIPTCQVQWHKGKEELTIALQGSDIVVIGDDSKQILNSEKDALISTASKVVDFVYAVAQTTPKAMVVVAASPLNLMVPLAGYVLKELGCYDGRKLLGVTSVDTLRANAIYSEYIAQPNSILPVVGGASPQTRVPIFSHARPSLDLSEEDMHHLIDKIKSFDLNMEGPELKASTLERAYATVRLVNSLLSGLREEPSTKEMALAKTSLIPEVNYFSLPVDLGKSGIERTFGLPQLSQLETEMIDYAIINLNNDLIKAQDLYASFKPCFEMLKSIVGCSSRETTGVTNDGSNLQSDSKTKIQQKKDQKLKERSIKRKRCEQHLRNRKRSRANKFPIIHCPAHEVVTDMPIAEKFGKIERVHKKLQVNQIFQERNVNELPVLNSNKVTALGPSHHQLSDPSSSLEIVIKNCVTKNVDLANVNIDLENNSMGIMKIQRPSSDSKSPNTIDLMDLQNNSKAIHKAANQNFDCKNVLQKIEDPSKNVKVTIDLKCKVKKNNIYDNLQHQAHSQSSRIEMIKSQILEKQKQYQKIKDLNLSDSFSNKDKMEYLKKKAMELKTPNIKRFPNKPNTPKLESSGKHKTTECESYEDTISGSQMNKATNKKLQVVERIQKAIAEKASIDKVQCNLLKKDKGVLKQEMKTETEARDDQETINPKEEVNTKQNEKNNGKNLLEKKVGLNMKANDGMIHEKDKQISNKIKETDEKKIKESEKDSRKPLTHDKINTELASQHNKNISVADNRESEINKNNIISEEKVALTDVQTGVNNNKSDCNASNIVLEKINEIETCEQNDKRVQAKAKKEDGKLLIKYSKQEANKEEDERFNEEMSRLICEVAESNKSEKEISEQLCPLIDEGKAVKEINVLKKLEELKILSKRKEIDGLKIYNQKINDAITSKESPNPLEQASEKREFIIPELKESSKSSNLPKLNKASVTERVEEKGEVKTKAREDPEDKKEKPCDFEGEVSENIEVFKYVPQKIHDTRNLTNINEIVQDFVKTRKPEANSELPIADQDPVHDIKDQVHVIDSKALKMKVINLNKKAGQLTIKQSEAKHQKKDDERVKSSNEEAKRETLKKPHKETPLPFMEMSQDEGFDKNEWLKQKVQTVSKINPSNKNNLKTIDESKAVTLYSRDMNESFTKIVQNAHGGSNKISDKTQLVSYAVDTKTKKDELSKRYTVLKKGQLCNMVKDDINANELKAKLYQSSQIKTTVKPSLKQDDSNITSVKGSYNESSKNLATNKEISIYGSSSNVLMATKKVSYNLRKDVNNLKNSNNNAMTLNKSFLNLVINRISKRSPTLNETGEAIGVRGSHYGSGTYSKSNAADEEKIQQLTKKAKEQLTMTKFKNDKRISHGLSGSLPVVSNELGQKRQPAIDKGLDKPKLTNDLTDIMMRNKNKIQLMKERHQRLKNENQPPKNVVTSPSSGANKLKSKEKKIAFYGVKTPIIESKNKNSSKNKKEPKYEVKKGEIRSKQDESFSVKPITETGISTLGKTKPERNDSVKNEKDEYLVDINNNSSETLNEKHSTDTEAECPELSQNEKPASSGIDDKTTLTLKKCSQENQQSSEDKNKSNKECLRKQQESLKRTIDEDRHIISNAKLLKEETFKKIKYVENKKSCPYTQQLTPRKKVFHERTQEIGKFKSKESIIDTKDISRLKKSANTVSKEKPQQPKVNLAHENALKSIQSIKQKSKPANEHQQREALQGVFSSRPTTWDLIKMKEEQKTDNYNITVEKVPSFNFGVRTVVGNNLIPRHSTASSLLIDPDLERRPTTSRKEIHPSLLHAVNPFHSQKTDLTKLKTNFYSRWTPQTLKSKGNKEGGTQEIKNEGMQKNPFVSGKISLTSDLFKAYMKQNRKHEFPNSNGDVQFLHQSGQLASIPQQGIAATTSRINDQRVAFSTLESNSENKVFPKHEIIKSRPKVSMVNKTSTSQSSLFNKSKRINKISEESLANGSTAKGKNTLHGSSKSKKLVSTNKSNENLTQPFNPFRCREKGVDLKRIHLLKAFQNQEKNETKFGELERNYKKQIINRTPDNTLKNQGKELSKGTPNRLQMLKSRSVESIKHLALEDNSRNKKPFSAPGHYHPSFPLSKPKKNDNNKKKEEGNSTLKKRWTQLLDIFQSVITTEKKNWEQDGSERNLLVADGPLFSKNAVVPKAKIVLREPPRNPDSTGKSVQTYYKKHSVGGSKFQRSYSPINTTNKM